MEEQQIIQLYWDRNQHAIDATTEKYGAYCHTIAMHILDNREDAEECVNDTWLHAWNAMPPHHPSVLATFLGKITRNLSFNRYQQRSAAKRGSGQLPLVLYELADCVSGAETPEQALDRQALIAAINDFLTGLPPRHRQIFLRRYWYADTISDIARRHGMTENHTSVILRRLRLKLRNELTERGWDP